MKTQAFVKICYLLRHDYLFNTYLDSGSFSPVTDFLCSLPKLMYFQPWPPVEEEMKRYSFLSESFLIIIKTVTKWCPVLWLNTRLVNNHKYNLFFFELFYLKITGLQTACESLWVSWCQLNLMLINFSTEVLFFKFGFFLNKLKKLLFSHISHSENKII